MNAHASSTYPVPDSALDRHIAILGKTGSGKSNGAKTIAEKLLASGDRVCVIDPTGTWWGLRVGKDGKSNSGLEPVIFGGNHADIPIAGEHGAAIAEAIGTSSTSAVIDTRLMRVGERTRFFTDFAEGLLRSNRGPIHLIIDEAHLFAPQGRVNDPQSGAMVGAANNLVSLGRGIGLRIIMISQRPAKLHKDSLTQVETLVAMRLIAPQDRAAIKDWVGEWADPSEGKEIIASLPSLATGDAWVWSPEIGLLARRHFPLASTFDSGKPSAGVEAHLQAIDVDAMTERLASIRQDVVANDPKRLKARVAELEREIARKPAAVDPKAVEEAERRGYERGYQNGHSRAREEAFAEFSGKISELSKWANGNSEIAALPMRPDKPVPAVKPRKVTKSEVSTDLGAERKPLAILAASYPAGYTEAQWASLAGYKRTGGTWGTYKSRLRVNAMIEERGGLWHATEAGVEAIGGALQDIPSTPEERLAMWKSKIASVGPMLDVLHAIYPDEIDKDGLAERLEMTASGGTFGTYLSRLRTNGLIEEPQRGFFRLSDVIMAERPGQ